MDGNVVTKHLNQSTYLLYEFYFILCRYWILKISLRSNIKGSKQAKVGHYKFYRNNMGCMLNSADRVIFDRQKSCLEIQCMWFELPHLSKEQRIGEKCNYCTYQEDIEKPQKGEHCLPRAEFLRTSFVFEMDVSVSWMYCLSTVRVRRLIVSPRTFTMVRFTSTSGDFRKFGIVFLSEPENSVLNLSKAVETPRRRCKNNSWWWHRCNFNFARRVIVWRIFSVYKLVTINWMNCYLHHEIFRKKIKILLFEPTTAVTTQSRTKLNVWDHN